MVQIFRKLWRWFVIATAILLANVAVAMLCVPVAHIDQSACDEIQPGMTVDDAEAIIRGRLGGMLED